MKIKSAFILIFILFISCTNYDKGDVWSDYASTDKDEVWMDEDGVWSEYASMNEKAGAIFGMALGGLMGGVSIEPYEFSVKKNILDNLIIHYFIIKN